ncbi:MAG: phosphotransferase family protein [Rhizomicrobium sp.]
MAEDLNWEQTLSGTQEMREGHRFDLKLLESYLADRIEGFRTPLEVRQFRGGQSNPTYELITPGRRYVLRCQPRGNLLPSAHAIDREYRVISALHPTGFPVARPYLLCDDQSVIGTMFYVMEHVEGRIYWEPLLPHQTQQQRHAIYDAMNATIARLHNVDWRSLSLNDFGKPGNYIARQIARWTKQYKASETEPIEEMEKLIEWLPQHLPEAPSDAIVHGDYRLDNIIWHPSEPRVLAVIDWELCTIGDPMADFTYHLMQWQMPRNASKTGMTLLDADLPVLGVPSMDEYTGRYLARTRREGLPELDYYAAYNFFRLAGILQGIVGRVRDGTAASARAAENASRVRPLAERGWRYALRAGASG